MRKLGIIATDCAGLMTGASLGKETLGEWGVSAGLALGVSSFFLPIPPKPAPGAEQSKLSGEDTKSVPKPEGSRPFASNRIPTSEYRTLNLNGC